MGSEDDGIRDWDLLENHSFQDLNLPNYQYIVPYKTRGYM